MPRKPRRHRRDPGRRRKTTNQLRGASVPTTRRRVMAMVDSWCRSGTPWRWLSFHGVAVPPCADSQPVVASCLLLSLLLSHRRAQPRRARAVAAFSLALLLCSLRVAVVAIDGASAAVVDSWLALPSLLPWILLLILSLILPHRRVRPSCARAVAVFSLILWLFLTYRSWLVPTLPDLLPPPRPFRAPDDRPLR